MREITQNPTPVMIPIMHCGVSHVKTEPDGAATSPYSQCRGISLAPFMLSRNGEDRLSQVWDSNPLNVHTGAAQSNECRFFGSTHFQLYTQETVPGVHITGQEWGESPRQNYDYISSHYSSLKKHIIGRQLEGNVARCLENRSPPVQVTTFRVKLQNYTNY